MPRNLSRRRFLQTSAAGVAAVGFWSSLEPVRAAGPNEKLNIGCVGTGNRAANDIDGVRGENIVALCDVDENFLGKAAGQFPGATRYHDFREMFEKEKSLDAVVIGTPDHLHAMPSMWAIQRGLHVYCEKPLTHSVYEARKVTEAAAAKGVATQMGTQIHAGDNYRRVVELVQSGAIGPVREVHVWVGKGWGGGERPTEGDPVPESLKWDLWLGPAPERPYKSGRYHPAQWRRWWDFGGGTMADMACHYMDLPFWALGLAHCETVEAEGPPVHEETCPLGLIVRYTFPPRGKQPPVKLTWYDGNLTPREVAGHAVPGSGVMFIGDSGHLFADYGSYRLYPEEKFAGFTAPEQSIPRSIGHHAEWIKACKEGTPTTCAFSYSGPLAESVLLGNVAYRAGEAFTWDAAALRTSSDKANRYLQRDYRAGWRLEG